MRTIHAVRVSSQRVVAAGREKIQAKRRNRHRDSLLVELGQVCFDDRSGSAVGDVDGDINRLVARLVLLDEPEDRSDDIHEDDEPAEILWTQGAHESVGS